MKKVSAAFDGLKFSTGTLEYAVYIASRSKSLLTGIFLDDFTYHSYKLTDMVGTHGVSKVKLKNLVEKDSELRNKSADKFKSTCIKNHIEYIIHHDRSIAAQELLKESVYSDLLLISPDETFTHSQEEYPTRFIKDLLIEIQCPVILVPREYSEISRVILLYDGTPTSVFAIKMFNYLMPWMLNLDTEVVSVVDPSVQTHFPDDELIKEFINCHYPGAKYTLLYGNPEIEIPGYLKKLPLSTLVVLGAYRRSAVSRWFRPSLADLLMSSLKLPLFIAHK